MVKLDMFTLAYLECALWSSTDDNGVPCHGRAPIVAQERGATSKREAQNKIGNP